MAYKITCEDCGQEVYVDRDNLIENHPIVGNPGPGELCSASKTRPLNPPGGSVWAIPTAFEQGKNRKH